MAKKTWNTYELSDRKANRKTVESYLDRQKPSLVIFNGHGDAGAVLGHNNEALISIENKNEHLLAGKSVFIRACTAGSLLGKSIKEKGAKGFIGYKIPFVFWHDPTANLSHPLRDLDAEPFRICSNQVAISLLKNHTVREAHNLSIATYRREIVKLLSSTSTRGYLIPELIANMKNQVCYD
ncbi:MAG: hypothetical protein HYW97_00540 [Candidatus Wildermuthbacteria bacterium]|nr:hypothetical protein [Candidatus Wildermuthbacteria bacterium]